MEQFKARIDQKIWDMYRIEVEHLCARNPDGTKRTYEQMFYHVPVRKSGGGYSQGTILGYHDRWNPWCQAALKRNAKPQNPGDHYRIPTEHPVQLVPEAQNLRGGTRDSNWQRELLGVRNSKPERNQGFPAQISPWCRKLKIDKVKTPFSTERGTATRKYRNVVEYLGIAADEPARFGQLNAKKRAPLVEFGIDEDLCGLYCQYNDMLAPTYETSCRDGCWFCHNQGVDQLRLLRRNYPDLWTLLMKWDLDSPVTFKADGHTVHDFDRRFRMEDERKIPTDRTFRWSMLYEPPKFVAWIGEQTSMF